MKNFGDFTKNLVFNTSFPPATASQDKWPILADIIRDLGQSADEVKVPAIRSWLSTYALVNVVEKFGTPDTISKDAITAALKAAKDVDMFNMVPAWTPPPGTAGWTNAGPRDFSTIGKPSSA